MRKAVPQHQSLLGQMDRLPQGETRSYSRRSPHLTMVEVRGHSLPRPDLNTEQKGVLFWGGTFMVLEVLDTRVWQKE